MSVEIHVTKIEAIGQGSVLVSVVIESEQIGSIELEVEGDLKTDSKTQDPIVQALGEVRDKLLTFADELQVELQTPDVLTRMVHLSLPDEATEWRMPSGRDPESQSSRPAALMAASSVARRPPPRSPC
jgi:hypothetical protein